MTTAAERRIRHFGDGTHWSGHGADRLGGFDYWCVAHDEDYSPKYLGGEFCHDSMGEGWCNDGCHLCPRLCEFDPCPIPVEP